eukprot:1139323-Amphidinium_carterae.1
MRLVPPAGDRSESRKLTVKQSRVTPPQQHTMWLTINFGIKARVFVDLRFAAVFVVAMLGNETNT